jgi:hypothetical protein
MFWGERKKETISPNYAAHQLKASSFAYKSKAFLSVQNIEVGTPLYLTFML